MPLWELAPIDMTDPNWQASSHRGRVIVRAPDEEAAREAAAETFDVPTRFPPGGGVKAPPWRRPSSVRTELIEDERYDAEGPTEVLDPAL